MCASCACRQERLRQLKEAAQRPKFGSMGSIARDEFVSQVTEGSRDNWVVVLLYQERYAADCHCKPSRNPFPCYTQYRPVTRAVITSWGHPGWVRATHASCVLLCNQVHACMIITRVATYPRASGHISGSLAPSPMGASTATVQLSCSPIKGCWVACTASRPKHTLTQSPHT